MTDARFWICVGLAIVCGVSAVPVAAAGHLELGVVLSGSALGVLFFVPPVDTNYRCTDKIEPRLSPAPKACPETDGGIPLRGLAYVFSRTGLDPAPDRTQPHGNGSGLQTVFTVEPPVLALEPWNDETSGQPLPGDVDLLRACLDGLLASGLERDDALFRCDAVYQKVRRSLLGGSRAEFSRLRGGEIQAHAWRDGADRVRFERDELANPKTVVISDPVSRETMDELRDSLAQSRPILQVEAPALELEVRALVERITPDVLNLPIPTVVRELLQELVALVAAPAENVT